MGSGSKQKVYIDLIHYPLYTLGPGERVGVWFQGCDFKCSECIATHTWKQTEEKSMHIESLIEQLKSISLKKLTISGGEPFNQPEALLKLVKSIRYKFDDIMLYSGYKYSYLQENFPEILDLMDVLIDGQFVKTLPTDKIYKGSNNQKIFLFNRDLVDTYSEYILQTKQKLQIVQKEKETYVLGIPKSTDTQSVKEILLGIEQ